MTDSQKLTMMKIIRFAFLIVLFVPVAVMAQERYYTRNGHTDFYSHAPLEDIKANNEQVAVFLNVTDGSISAAMLMKSFVFEKALMQQHFNENYVESDEFPRSEFKGNILNFNTIDFSTPIPKKVTANGMISLHGVTREISVEGTITKKEDKYHIDAKFLLKPADFDIGIPASVKDNIAKEIEVTLNAQLVAM
jgi:hypothetical protein